MARRTMTLAMLLLLAGCSSLPMGGAPAPSEVDVLNADVAGALFVLDLPQTLEPTPEDSSVAISLVAGAEGERRVDATLWRADPGELAGLLPPPADGRSYYLFGLDAADQTAVREAQAWARGRTVQSAITLRPGVCRTDAIDLGRTTISALMVTPGRVQYLIRNAPLSVHAGTNVAPCAGHSG